jgi:hypothetical protein
MSYDGSENSIDDEATSYPSRCFFTKATGVLTFNKRGTQAPGTGEKPKLCGSRIKMIQLQADSCWQAAFDAYFDSQHFNFGWPALQSDWKKLLKGAGFSYTNTTGFDMWMMASDGTRMTGPYGVRCWKGSCDAGQWVGRSASGVYEYQKTTRNWGAKQSDEIGYDKKCTQGLVRGCCGNANGIPRDMPRTWGSNCDLTADGGEHCYASPCNFHNGWRWVNLSSSGEQGSSSKNPGPVFLSEADITAGKYSEADAKSCETFYDSNMATYQLEIGIPPSESVPTHGVRYPTEIPTGNSNCARMAYDGHRCEDGIAFVYKVMRNWARPIGSANSFIQNVDTVINPTNGNFDNWYATNNGYNNMCSTQDCKDFMFPIRPRRALSNVYKAGDFLMLERVAPAYTTCHRPNSGHAHAHTLDAMYGTVPESAWLAPTSTSSKCNVVGGKRMKFITGDLDMDDVTDFAWCECEAAPSDRCKLDDSTVPVVPVNGGTVLSFWGCQVMENKNGIGNAKLNDAPMAYLDPVNDATCSCTLPRCFRDAATGQNYLGSAYEVTGANGAGQSLSSWLGAGHAYVNQISAALQNCCQLKTNMYISYAEQNCSLTSIDADAVCQNTPVGYEPVFDNAVPSDGRGPDQHVAASACIDQAWQFFGTITVANKNTISVNEEQTRLLEPRNEEKNTLLKKDNIVADDLVSLLSNSARGTSSTVPTWCRADVNGIIFSSTTGAIEHTIDCAVDCTTSAGCVANHNHLTCCRRHCPTQCTIEETENELSSLIETTTDTKNHAQVGWDCW